MRLRSKTQFVAITLLFLTVVAVVGIAAVVKTMPSGEATVRVTTSSLESELEKLDWEIASSAKRRASRKAREYQFPPTWTTKMSLLGDEIAQFEDGEMSIVDFESALSEVMRDPHPWNRRYGWAVVEYLGSDPPNPSVWELDLPWKAGMLDGDANVSESAIEAAKICRPDRDELFPAIVAVLQDQRVVDTQILRLVELYKSEASTLVPALVESLMETIYKVDERDWQYATHATKRWAPQRNEREYELFSSREEFCHHLSDVLASVEDSEMVKTQLIEALSYGSGCQRLFAFWSLEKLDSPWQQEATRILRNQLHHADRKRVRCAADSLRYLKGHASHALDELRDIVRRNDAEPVDSAMIADLRIRLVAYGYSQDRLETREGLMEVLLIEKDIWGTPGLHEAAKESISSILGTD